jgi:hypothetical protein
LIADSADIDNHFPGHFVRQGAGDLCNHVEPFSTGC